MTRIRPAAALLALVLAATACSTTVPGTATVTLDTGNLPTTPRAVVAHSAGDAWQQEGWRIADAVPAPWEIDTAFSHPTGTGQLIGPVFSPNTLVTEDFPGSAAKVQVLTFGGLRTGFVAAAQDGDGRGAAVLRVGLLRFSNADSAARTLDRLATGDDESVPGGRVVVDIVRDGRVTMYAMGTKADLIVIAAVTGAASRTDAIRLLGTALTLQRHRADEYPDPEYPDAVPKVPMDERGVMSRTLESTTSPEVNIVGLSPHRGRFDGYRSIRADALVGRGRSYLTEAGRYGVDLVGETGQSVVFRAGSAAEADDYRTRRWQNGGSCIPGIPRERSSCTESGDGEHYIRCAVSIGRWVAMTGSTNRLAVRQRCAALYEILQNAE